MLHRIIIVIIVVGSTLIQGCKSGPDESTPGRDKERIAVQPEESISPGEKGVFYVQRTQSVLASNLMKAIQRKGSDGAVIFCNTRALPLTDSIAIHHGVSIQRVSDKPRNPENVANAEESRLIREFSDQINAGTTSQPVIKEAGDMTTFYSPIVTTEMCLQCHGNRENNISTATLQAIDSLYPMDLATGYEANQVRGVWKIGWNDQNKK